MFTGTPNGFEASGRAANTERKKNVVHCHFNRCCKAGQTVGAFAGTSDDSEAYSLKVDIKGEELTMNTAMSIM